jgi:hypothetical protein
MVVGFHRSGTSLLAGILSKNGIHMGDKFAKPMGENPKGFWECIDFKRINERLLSDVGYNVKSWKPEIPMPRWDDSIKAKAAALIRQRQNDHEDWGWKDPRNCLTIRLWAELLQDLELKDSTRILWSVRDRDAICRSLQAREYGRGMTIEHARRMQDIYANRLKAAVSDFLLPCCLIQYEDLLHGRPVLDPIVRRKVDYSFVDPGLNRHG